MIRISPSLSISRLDDEVILLDSASGKYFGLNAVGSRMFTLLKETLNQEKTLKILSGEYIVEPDRLRKDMETLLRDLKSKGLLETDEV